MCCLFNTDKSLVDSGNNLDVWCDYSVHSGGVNVWRHQQKPLRENTNMAQFGIIVRLLNDSHNTSVFCTTGNAPFCVRQNISFHAQKENVRITTFISASK